MFKKKKQNDEVEAASTTVTEETLSELAILVTEEDRTGSDIMRMSDFYSIAMEDMSRELINTDGIITVRELPIADISTVNNAIRSVGVFSSPEFDLVPDFASLPEDIREQYKAGKLVLGESKQVSGNIRAVLVDAKTKTRIKDVTLKKVERTDVTAEISQNMLTQMQLRQISDKLDHMISEQEYLIDFSRNQAIVRPFLDARDNILMAQYQTSAVARRNYLLKASGFLRTAINSVYVDMNTIENNLAKEAHKKWFQRINRKSIDSNISRLASDTMVVTRYVGLQIQVFHHLKDSEGKRAVLEGYHANIERLFQNGVIDPNLSLALWIHENIEYTDDNRDCWYYLEEKMKPMLNKAYNKIESGEVYILTGDDYYGKEN
ncbi:hypothetical protein SAMN04487770_12945 [Butyrivibrio sp. ob235]|uniref:hypothetical protein n=1 Tax=Butyrivibrio sp. ob235 TaxID=1761780 RepID=UPI0008D32E63|nr:hypothetical protein [Butyrivibrio sp. ob235]SEM22744.1 hypothetical protein SAMN04487770_12945 [Butyrivibrio sp. ob235]